MEGLKLKKYQPTRIWNSEKPMISLGLNDLRFNIACLPYLQRKDFCELYFDESNEIIALKPMHIRTNCTLRMTTQERRLTKVNKRISCTHFIRENNLIHHAGLNRSGKTTRPYLAQWDNKNKWFLIDLKGRNVNEYLSDSTASD